MPHSYQLQSSLFCNRKLFTLGVVRLFWIWSSKYATIAQLSAEAILDSKI